MVFRIADTFTDSLARLSGEEQKAVKTTAFDLQLNPANPGMQFHRIERAKDRNFWSVRVNDDIRLIVHKTDSSLLLCYVAHHDKAYAWAGRRKLETHPNTGAAQLVEIRETVKEFIIPKYVEEVRPSSPKPRLFARFTDDELLKFGVPLEWVHDIRAADEDSILDLAIHLPAEAAEALLNLATGATPILPEAAPEDEDPFAHPDAQRRFRVIANVEELQRALEYPWEKWTIFLHPAQRELVEKDFNGPARISGSAGTGKTIVALHRAVFLARKHPDARVLLATFSETLANALRTRLRRLISNEPRLGERLEVHPLNTIGNRLFELNIGKFTLASKEQLRHFIADASNNVQDHKFSLSFLVSEWEQIVDAWQLETWESYRDVARLGRKTRLPERQRRVLWSIFEQVRAKLHEKQLRTEARMFIQLSEYFDKASRLPFDFIVIDEAQDINVSQLRFLSSLGGQRTNGLFFTGDLGQRIFQQAFSWKALGVDIRGRSKTLRINYRTSHQIRIHADRLLGPELSDVDGNVEVRQGTLCVFSGPPPVISILKSREEEIDAVASWLCDLSANGVAQHEIGLIVRSSHQFEFAWATVRKAGLQGKELNEEVDVTSGFVSIMTMHLAKGLEFRAVAIMACDDEIVPLQERIESVGDDSDLENVYNTERHLLYVACTRARDYLLVTSSGKPSEFLEDLRQVGSIKD